MSPRSGNLGVAAPLCASASRICTPPAPSAAAPRSRCRRLMPVRYVMVRGPPIDVRCLETASAFGLDAVIAHDLGPDLDLLGGEGLERLWAAEHEADLLGLAQLLGNGRILERRIELREEALDDR